MMHKIFLYYLRVIHLWFILLLNAKEQRAMDVVHPALCPVDGHSRALRSFLEGPDILNSPRWKMLKLRLLV
jgi:hypothetical protein